MKLEDVHVDWRDADLPTSRHYGDGGNLQQDDATIRLIPSLFGLKFIPIFGAIFWPVATIAAFLFAPPPYGWLFAVLIPICGGPALLMMYQILKSNIDAGPYIAVDLACQTVALPRIGLTASIADIVCLQWISGRCHSSNSYNTDLNLITKTDHGRTRRYVMGSPDRYHVRKLSKAANIPVIEIDAGLRGFRDIQAEQNA